ncbi:general transcription factor II-I repeat domain-containing protein 2-like isoform X3 [Lynx canadensis]|uniref:general transcription factor II-I repeat domain-containing protein 2-like isoform X3 n=1 Tax=Lynx canadensis TaxID=61383 RepID=UPI0011B0A6DF|nr:general transcription factor II-I repeat domain-containing protein 2-like isoform X3 [Lynx canadensis]
MRRKKIRTRSWAKMRKSLSKKHLINGRRRWLNRRLPLKSKNRDWKLEIPKHLIKDLPDKVTQRELKEVFKDAFQIRLVSKDGMNKRIAYADFKSQADAERALEDKQGTKIGGLAIALDPVGEKSQGQEERGWKNSTWRTHEGADVDNAPQLAVFIRGVDETFDVTEELLDMVPMTGTSSGNELFVCVEESLKKFNVDWSKLVSVSTDGNSALVGVEQLVTELKSKVSGLCKDTELKSVHGLILQESLCTKKLKMDHVMDIVIHTITWIRSHGSDHREFSALFSELDAQYGSLFSVGLKWLSRGMVLRRFFELLEEIDFFMSSKGKPVPQLTSKDWVKDLAFLVDIMTYLNMLDISLQRRSQVVTQMYDSIHSFLMKLCLWETHLARNNLAHFPTLKLVSENERDGLNYIPRIKELKTEFQKRFSDFKLYESELTLFSSPFSVNINNVSEELQMEVIELQCNTILKTKYDCVGIPEFYKHLGNGYPKYKNHCAKILSMFGSTYVCEQLFSVMKQQKTKYCPQLKDSGVTSLRHVAAPDTHPGVE